MGSCQSYCTQPRHATQRKDWCCLSVHELCKALSLTQQKISIRLKTACMICLLKHDLSHIVRAIICISPCNLSHGGSSLILFKLYSVICAIRRTLDCGLSRAYHCGRRRGEHLGQLLAVTLNCTDCIFFTTGWLHLYENDSSATRCHSSAFWTCFMAQLHELRSLPQLLL